ncbi:MAG: hypothetical protein K0S44_830, partial [Bacteroidetes bacterium]|nr:hypothetical protein [Bacteroidota bacterium]
MSMRQKVDLVAVDYYEQELKFQEKINHSLQSNELKEPLTWNVSQEQFVLDFPSQFDGKQIKGEVFFLRQSDKSLDKKIGIPINNSLSKVISTKELEKGVYKIEITWEVMEVEYYNEGIIRIN